MKNFLKVVLCLAILAAGAPAVNAQGIGGLLKKGKEKIEKGKKAAKKGKETVEKIFGSGDDSSETTSSPDATTSTSGGSQVNKTVSSSGIIVSNPLSSFIEIEPVGLYGVSKSENYGDAYLVLKVKKLIPQDITKIGSSVQNQKMVAVDNNGKVYNVDASGVHEFDTPEGLMVRVVIDQPGLMFTDIKKDVNMMQQVKFGVLSDAQHQGNVTLNNVPIFWDETID